MNYYKIIITLAQATYGDDFEWDIPLTIKAQSKNKALIQAGYELYPKIDNVVKIKNIKISKVGKNE